MMGEPGCPAHARLTARLTPAQRLPGWPPDADHPAVTIQAAFQGAGPPGSLWRGRSVPARRALDTRSHPARHPLNRPRVERVVSGVRAGIERVPEPP